MKFGPGSGFSKFFDFGLGFPDDISASDSCKSDPFFGKIRNQFFHAGRIRIRAISTRIHNSNFHYTAIVIRKDKGSTRRKELLWTELNLHWLMYSKSIIWNESLSHPILYERVIPSVTHSQIQSLTFIVLFFISFRVNIILTLQCNNKYFHVKFVHVWCVFSLSLTQSVSQGYSVVYILTFTSRI